MWVPTHGHLHSVRLRISTRSLGGGSHCWRVQTLSERKGARQIASMGVMLLAARHQSLRKMRLQRRSYRGQQLPLESHPALGIPLRPMGEMVWPKGAAAQKEAAKFFEREFVTPKLAQQGCAPEHTWDLTRPCIIRGFAREWDFVKRARLDPTTDALWREALRDESCLCEFQPSQSHMKYELVEGMEPSLRLVNPAALVFRFPDFLDACHLKRCGYVHDGDTNATLASDSAVRQVMAANVVYEEDCWRDDPRYLPMFPRNVDLDITSAAEYFSLYCAQQEFHHWPNEILQSISPNNPFSDLMPSWPSEGVSSNIWMCGGGPGRLPVSCNFHCDFSENLHIVLSGRKDVTMCHPADAGVLHGTSYCAQAAWSIDDGWPLSTLMPSQPQTGDAECGRPPKVHVQEVIRDNLRTPMCLVSLDATFEENCQLCPGLRKAAERWHGDPHLCTTVNPDPCVAGDVDVSDYSSWHPSGPLWAEAHAGDSVYIPPGWFHFIRTWHPNGEERGLPFALSVNFWHNCCEEMWEKERLFRMLEVRSIQQALAGDREKLLKDFLSQFHDEPPLA